MRFLDNLRGSYVGAPPWLQSIAGRALALVPPAYAYGKSFRVLRADIERSRRDPDFVDERVRCLLQELLMLANTTQHYHPQLAEIDLRNPSRADLATLPILTRDVVRADTERMLARPKEHMDVRRTTGSSQASLEVFLDRDRSVREWAFLTNVWGRSGFCLGDRRACVRRGHEGLHADWSWEPGTRQLRLTPYRMVPPMMDLFLGLIADYRITYLHGYPSAVTQLAAHAQRIGWEPPTPLRGVLPISERLLPHQRAIMHEAFGPISIQPVYGLTEKVAFAGEIGGHEDTYEFEPLYGIAEIVDEHDQPVRIGQRGRLVGTGFVSMGMPLIRYDTGDLATLVEEPSAGNCWRLRARDISSSYAQEFIVTKEGGLVSGLLAYVRDDRVSDYQIAQFAPGHITLRIVPESGTHPDRLVPIPARVQAAYDNVVSVDMEVVSEIPLTAGGKKRFVEQHLNLSEYGGIDGAT